MITAAQHGRRAASLDLDLRGTASHTHMLVA